MATTPSTETIALLLPTRKRPPLLVRFWESVAATAEHPELVTVVLVVDEDDPETLQVVNNLSGLKKCLLVGPPSALAVEKWTRAFCATRCESIDDRFERDGVNVGMRRTAWYGGLSHAGGRERVSLIRI